MAHLSRNSSVYTDTTITGPSADWQYLDALFAQLMSTWPDSAIYQTRIVGEDDSAVVFFPDSPELFGRELRALGAIDFRRGKVVRRVATGTDAPSPSRASPTCASPPSSH
ncbi:hypothetical protein ACFW3D_26960 [Streptomyces sp. NPDC058864]